MRVNSKSYRTIWREQEQVVVIDQTQLPHQFVLQRLTHYQHAAQAIKDMVVRGAPLIGVTAAYGMALAMIENPSNTHLHLAAQTLIATRPTAVNLRWAVTQVVSALECIDPPLRPQQAFALADQLAQADVHTNATIGQYGAQRLRMHWEELGRPERLNVLTHCNAGWLGCVDWGTALATIYQAHDDGVPVHVWVDETRPRNQGASLTMWELAAHGVPATLIVDNAGGLLMQQNQVDVCMVGADRVTARGDVCNKVGTYLKALAAHAHGIPFYVALPLSTMDWQAWDGTQDIEIENRDAHEVTHITGLNTQGEVTSVQLVAQGCTAYNPAFDITPAHLVRGLITELGIIPANGRALSALKPSMTAD